MDTTDAQSLHGLRNSGAEEDAEEDAEDGAAG